MRSHMTRYHDASIPPPMPPPPPELDAPLPWRERDDGFGIEDANGDLVKIYGNPPQFPKEASHRRRIIRAVNAYDRLLAAAKGMVDGPKYACADFYARLTTLQAAIRAAEE